MSSHSNAFSNEAYGLRKELYAFHMQSFTRENKKKYESSSENAGMTLWHIGRFWRRDEKPQKIILG